MTACDRRCNPCEHCANYSISPVWVGDAPYGNYIDEEECGADVEWEGPESGPCPGFTAIPPSFDLMLQLQADDCYREWCDGMQDKDEVN